MILILNNLNPHSGWLKNFLELKIVRNKLMTMCLELGSLRAWRSSRSLSRDVTHNTEYSSWHPKFLKWNNWLQKTCIPDGDDFFITCDTGYLRVLVSQEIFKYPRSSLMPRNKMAIWILIREYDQNMFNFVPMDSYRYLWLIVLIYGVQIATG